MHIRTEHTGVNFFIFSHWAIGQCRKIITYRGTLAEDSQAWGPPGSRIRWLAAAEQRWHGTWHGTWRGIGCTAADRGLRREVAPYAKASCVRVSSAKHLPFAKHATSISNLWQSFSSSWPAGSVCSEIDTPRSFTLDVSWILAFVMSDTRKN